MQTSSQVRQFGIYRVTGSGQVVCVSRRMNPDLGVTGFAENPEDSAVHFVDELLIYGASAACRCHDGDTGIRVHGRLLPGDFSRNLRIER